MAGNILRFLLLKAGSTNSPSHDQPSHRNSPPGLSIPLQRLHKLILARRTIVHAGRVEERKPNRCESSNSY